MIMTEEIGRIKLGTFTSRLALNMDNKGRNRNCGDSHKGRSNSRNWRLKFKNPNNNKKDVNVGIMEWDMLLQHVEGI